ncbi:MAG: hypothetical protein JW850_04070 [Thermoflexales bacterium]|nr:hypothetical protein [Thermoflexales bacterium]
MATQTRNVMVYGNSLVVSGIAASLEHQPHLSVHQVNAANWPHQFESIKPDVLIFDLATDQPQATIALLKDHPHLLLIGVDLGSNCMFLWGGRPARTLTLQDLVQVIHSESFDTSEEKL